MPVGIIVCGGRHYNDKAALVSYRVLDHIHHVQIHKKDYPGRLGPTGADRWGLGMWSAGVWPS